MFGLIDIYRSFVCATLVEIMDYALPLILLWLTNALITTPVLVIYRPV